MSMLRYFLEIGTDKAIFDGLEISKETAICEKHMGQYPVISISLKGVEGFNYEAALKQMWIVIKEEAERFGFLGNSVRLTSREKAAWGALADGKEDISNSLKLLSRLLCRHYNKKVVILVDEYDVPLQKAQKYGYYDKMVMLIRQMFQAAFKTNDFL